MTRKKLNNHGSSSIIIILIAMTLVVLSVLSFVNTNSNYKLAKKSSEWIKEYYVVDKEYQIVLSKIWDTFNSVNDFTSAYIVNKEYMKSESSMIGKDIQKEIYEFHLNSKSDVSFEKEQFIEKRLFSYLSYIFLLDENLIVGEKISLSDIMYLDDEKVRSLFNIKPNVEINNSKRTIDVLISIFDGPRIISYKEVTSDFIYEELNFTDVEEK